MVVSPSNALATAPSVFVLTQTGQLFQWNTELGFQNSHSIQLNLQYFDSKAMNTSFFNDYFQWHRMSNLECSSHAMVCHLAYNKKVYNIDFRSNNLPIEVYSSEYIVSAMKKSSICHQNNIYICSHGNVSDVDLRYSKHAITAKYVPDR
jgi:hypothetical protein